MPRQVDLDMIELIDNKLTVDEYLKPCLSAGRNYHVKQHRRHLIIKSSCCRRLSWQDSQLAWDARGRRCSHLLRAGSCWPHAAGARVWNRITCSFKTDSSTSKVFVFRVLEMMFDLMCAKTRALLRSARLSGAPNRKIRTRNDPIYER